VVRARRSQPAVVPIEECSSLVIRKPLETIKSWGIRLHKTCIQRRKSAARDRVQMSIMLQMSRTPRAQVLADTKLTVSPPPKSVRPIRRVIRNRTLPPALGWMRHRIVGMNRACHMWYEQTRSRTSTSCKPRALGLRLLPRRKQA